MRINRAGLDARKLVQQFFREKKVAAVCTALVVALGGIAAVGGAAEAALDTANPAVSIHGKDTLCGKDEHEVTISRVDIRNNNFRGEPMCLTVYYHKANFQITSSGLHEAWAAYPNAFVGCEISVCSPHSGMPMQVSNIRQAYSSWRYHPGGPWQGNAAYDIWFNPTPMTTGQVNHGAEIMIWLNQSGIGRPYGTRVYIDGTWWAYTTWNTSQPGRTWHYIRFWRLSPTLSVTNLNLKNFFAYAERVHRLSSSWWLTSVESGYELWRGGVGMHTLSYSVLLTPWHAPKTATAAKAVAKPVTTTPSTPKPTPVATTPTPSPSTTTPSPTSTPVSAAPPTDTPSPSDTPSPTDVPTPTASPTDTPVPTPTPS